MGPSQGQDPSRDIRPVGSLAAAGIAHYARPQRGDVLVPLALPPGAERSATEAAVVAQLDALIAVVDATAVEVVEDESAE